MPINETPPVEIQVLPVEFQDLYRELPPLVTREVAFEKAPIFSPRTMANYDCRGLGPASRSRIGPKVVYTRLDYVVWLAAQRRDI